MFSLSEHTRQKSGGGPGGGPKKYEDWGSLLHKLKAGALYLFLIGSQAFSEYALFRPIPFLYGLIAIMSEPDVENYYSKSMQMEGSTICSVL